MKIICSSCSDMAEHDTKGYSLNIGEAAKATGFRPCFCGDCHTKWLCPFCAKMVVMLAEQIKKIVGTGDIEISQFLGENS